MQGSFFCFLALLQLDYCSDSKRRGNLGFRVSDGPRSRRSDAEKSSL